MSQGPLKEVQMIVVDPSGRRRIGLAVGGKVLGIYDSVEEAEAKALESCGGQIPWISPGDQLQDIVDQANQLADSLKGGTARRMERAIQRQGFAPDQLIALCARLVLLARANAIAQVITLMDVEVALSHIRTQLQNGKYSFQNLDLPASTEDEIANRIIRSFEAGAMTGRVAASRNALTKRHAENHSMKAQVFEWLDTNMGNYKSMDKARIDCGQSSSCCVQNGSRVGR